MKNTKKIAEDLAREMIQNLKKNVRADKQRRTTNLFGPDLGMKSVSEMPPPRPGQGSKL